MAKIAKAVLTEHQSDVPASAQGKPDGRVARGSSRRKPPGVSPANPGSLCNPRNLTELLNYRLAALVAASGAAVIRLCEGRYGVSRREWHLLGLLDALGPQSPSALAESCHLDRPRVSRAIAALSGKGLVKRSSLPSDQRRANVELTSLGRKLHRRIFEEVSSINARLAKGLDDVQLAQLDALLTLLKANADVVKREGAADVHADRWRGARARACWPVSSMDSGDDQD